MVCTVRNATKIRNCLCPVVECLSMMPAPDVKSHHPVLDSTVLPKKQLAIRHKCKKKNIIYGTPFAAKLCSTIGSSYFKNQLGFLHTWCFAELSWYFTLLIQFLFRTSSIFLKNWFNYFIGPTQLFFAEPSWFSHGTKLIFFREPSWFSVLLNEACTQAGHTLPQ